MAWDWIILDVAYVMVLVGGAMVLRVRGSSVFTWIAFGTLSTTVGAFLFTFTYVLQTAYAQGADVETPVTAMLAAC